MKPIEEDVLEWCRLNTAIRVLKHERKEIYKAIRPEMIKNRKKTVEMEQRRRRIQSRLYKHYTPEELDHRHVFAKNPVPVTCSHCGEDQFVEPGHHPDATLHCVSCGRPVSQSEEE